MDVKCWVQDSLSRVYPSTLARSSEGFVCDALRDEEIVVQACVRNESLNVAAVKVFVQSNDFIISRVRREGNVKIPHFTVETPIDELEGFGNIPGFVPDPLFDENFASVGPYETQAFWINIKIDRNASPGNILTKVVFASGDEIINEIDLNILVADIAVEKRHNFPVTHWFYADALCDWYGVNPFEDAFWPIVSPYMSNLVSHGNNCMYVPIFTPPTDGVKRPTQLLGVSRAAENKYRFDFSKVKKWVDLAKKSGADMFEWTHLFSQWGVKNALRIYQDNSDESSLLWDPDTSATSEVYRLFLAEFLPEFYTFLNNEDLLENSIFHISDEPHGDEHLANYRAARSMIAELAPWMKAADALSDIRYGKEGLTDIPIPSIAAAEEYNNAGIPAWTYFCCGPKGRYLNRFVDTPLAKIRMAGWLFYKMNAKGFLHWGYNYWYRSQTRELIDPFNELGSYAWPGFGYGDPFEVYPGVDGPIDSIRWEVFSQSLQDYAILQTLGINPSDEILSDIKSYSDFPKNAEWIINKRKELITNYIK